MAWAASTTRARLAVQAAVVTAMARDADFAATYRREFLGPKQAAARLIFERAKARGEIREDVDLDLIAPALPGVVLHRVFLLGDSATPELVARVIDQIIVPAVHPTADLFHPIARNLMTDTIIPKPEVTPAQHRRLTWALVLLSLAQLMVVLDSTIANIALPYIGADLDIDQANLSWIVTGYALTFGGFLLLGGRLADLYGRRRIFMLGVLLFAAASLVGGAAQSEAVLLGARGLQGLGAALASPAALALITTTFPAGKERNRAFAVFASMAGVGAAVGLVLGGWLTGLDDPLGIAGWRYTFLIVVPIGLAAAFFAPRVFAESDRHDGQLDVPGAITATGGLLAIVYGLSRAGDQRYGWSDQWTVTSLVVGAALIGIFLLLESRVEHPLLPFRILRSKNRAVAFAVMMIAPAAMFAMFFFLSLTVQLVVGYSPLKTGLAFLPFSVAMIISATAASKLIGRVDPRFLSGVGTLLSASALYGFHRLTVPEDGASLLATLPDEHGRAGPRPRRRHQLLDRDPAVRRADGVRHGAQLRAADPGRRPPAATRGLRHRLRRAEHDAAGRRCAGPRDAQHGRPPLQPEPRRRARPRRGGGGPGRRPRPVGLAR